MFKCLRLVALTRAEPFSCLRVPRRTHLVAPPQISLQRRLRKRESQYPFNLLERECDTRRARRLEMITKWIVLAHRGHSHATTSIGGRRSGRRGSAGWLGGLCRTWWRWWGEGRAVVPQSSHQGHPIACRLPTNRSQPTRTDLSRPPLTGRSQPANDCFVDRMLATLRERRGHTNGPKQISLPRQSRG